MPLNNLPSVYIPTVVKLLLSDPSLRTVSLKAEQEAAPAVGRVTLFAEPRVDTGRIGGWTPVDLGVSAGPGQWSPAWSGSYSWNLFCIPGVGLSLSCQCGMVAKLRLLRDLQGSGVTRWGARWLRSCRLPWTLLECAEPWAAGALGSPCWTGPKPARAHPHRSIAGMLATKETIVSPRGASNPSEQISGKKDRPAFFMLMASILKNKREIQSAVYCKIIFSKWIIFLGMSCLCFLSSL